MGGTFDPIHIGHLVTAEEALRQFKLDKVIFMPTGSPVHKLGEQVLSAEQRYLMTVIATSSNPCFDVSRLEIDRQGPTYTVDTVDELVSVYKGNVDIYFITGADAVWEILTWHDADRLSDLCSFIAATRPGYSLDKFARLHIHTDKSKKKQSKFKVFPMEIPALAISSTDIRKRLKDRRPIRYLVPESIVEYIEKHGFYR